MAFRAQGNQTERPEKQGDRVGDLIRFLFAMAGCFAELPADDDLPLSRHFADKRSDGDRSAGE
jgi:hypothetical protein